MFDHPHFGEAQESTFKRLQELINLRSPQVVDLVESDPSAPVEISEEDREEIFNLVFDGINDIEDKTVDDLLNDGEEVDLDEEQKSAAIFVASVTLFELFRRNLARIRLTQQWVQIPDNERQDALDSAISRAIDEADFAVRLEYSSHYSNIGKQVIESVGGDFIWGASLSDNPRDEHVPFYNQTFNIETAPELPGQAPGCQCPFIRVN